jgi:hypothetical protein
MGLLPRGQLLRQPRLHLRWQPHLPAQLQPLRRKERVDHRVKNRQAASRSRARPQLHVDVTVRG